MYTVKDIIGKKIIGLENGTDYGKVRDVGFNPSTHVVTMLILGQGLFSKTEVIQLSDIESVGDDAVMLKAGSAPEPAKNFDKADLTSIKAKDCGLIETKIIDEAGDELGKITDAEFSRMSGEIMSFTVSKGVVSDTLHGTTDSASYHILTVGKDYVIVDSTTKIILDHNHEGGVQDATEETIAKAKDSAKEISNATSEKMKDMKDATAEEIEDRNMVDRAQQAWQSVVATIKNLGDKATGAITDEMKKELAGKYATTNILNAEDEVLVERGEMITFEAIEKTEEAGQLKNLFSHSQVKELETVNV